MSDLSLAPQALERSRSQLPVSAYFDPALFEREQLAIFGRRPRYLGHELAVPEIGDHLALVQEGEGRALVRTHAGIELISNVCRHRQAIILRGRGSVARGGAIVCPLHRWTYDLHGRLLGAPHFDADPCLDLRNEPLQGWNGLLFETGGSDMAAELGGAGLPPCFDFSGHVLDRIHVHECDYNWKTFIEVYLEDYHVGPFHPGLGNFVTCEDLRWQLGADFSVQTVGLASAQGQALGRAGSEAYRRWQQAVLRLHDGALPPHGAIWLTSYPGLMLEWYPKVIVVSHLVPRGPQRTTNLVEFYYPEEIHAFEREYVEAQQAAYLETCVEDDEIALRMDQGRAALHARGDDDRGPYQSPMEDGMQHFHEWYRRRLGGTLR
ncbi:MAG: aromatic ring-hydroxylating dioxygenase subunit alpha [Piscinibacter sp.]|nr:aromatic ring-hydroxylating dioxygenase subunit alpha [Piscinibacter sp.]